MARAAALLPMLLAGCVATGGVQIGTGPDAFTIAAPRGYCLAEGAVARQRGSDFAAFTPCTGSTATGVLSATVGVAGSAQPVDPQAMAAFFASPAGRRALSRARDAASVQVHQVLAADGAILVLMTDRAPPPAAIGPGTSWRAVMAVDGRLVTLSASPARGTTLPPEVGRRLIGSFVAAMRTANAGT
ncbi:MAG: hypothetical protein ACT4OK_16100 [Gemmobacter sp.]